MINVSNEFFKTMQQRTNFKENAEITFADGTVLALTEEDFTITNNSIVDGAGSNGFPLGAAIQRSIQIELMNDDGRFSVYDFLWAKIRMYLTFELSESTEKIEEGIFTVVTPETYGETVIITAVDEMHRTDTPFIAEIEYPITLGGLYQSICDQCSLPYTTLLFNNHDFVVNKAPEGEQNCRQMLGYIAMIAGGNARINRQGYIEIKTYDFSILDDYTETSVDGGTFTPWTEGKVFNGGSFEPWTVAETLSGGTFEDFNKYHVLYNWKNLKVDTDDVIITGIRTTYTKEVVNGEFTAQEEVTILKGEEGYVLGIENPLISGSEEAALDLISNVLLGAKFRQFEGDHIGYPLAEFMDTAFVIDRKGNTYGTIITDINFNFFGFTTLKNSAESAVRNSSRYNSKATEIYRKTRELVDYEKTAREKAIEKLANTLANSSGLYITTEQQEDGSAIYYMHNKATLAESDIVWKWTAEAIGISTDGGKTYPYGFMVTGEMITQILSTEGINAEWIKSGKLDSERIDTEKLFAQEIAAKGTFTGEITATKGRIGLLMIGETLTYETTKDDKKIIFEIFGNNMISLWEVTNNSKSLIWGAGYNGDAYARSLESLNNIRTYGKVLATASPLRATRLQEPVNDSWLNNALASGAVNAFTDCTGLVALTTLRILELGAWVQAYYTNDSKYHLYFINQVNIDTQKNEPTADFTYSTDGTFNAKKISENGSLLEKKYLGINGNAVSATTASQTSGKMANDDVTWTLRTTGAAPTKGVGIVTERDNTKLFHGLVGVDADGNVVRLYALLDEVVPRTGGKFSGNVHVTTNVSEVGADGGARVYFGTNAMKPITDDTYATGTSENRWTNVYAVNGTIKTSDEMDKDILPEGITPAHEAWFMDLKPILYRWKQSEDNHKHDRVHCGLGARHTLKAAEKNGLDAEHVAAICRDDLSTQLPDGRMERYGIRYDELDGMEIHMIQKNTKCVEALERRIMKMQEEIDNLKHPVRYIKRLILEKAKRFWKRLTMIQ